MSKKISGEIIELGSGCLAGVNNEVIFKYPKTSQFPHDDFHSVIQMETDLYEVYEREEGDEDFEIMPFNVKVENGELNVYGTPYHHQDELIYCTKSIKGLPVEELLGAITSYLSRFTFVVPKQLGTNGLIEKKDISLNNKKKSSWEEYRAFIRKEQSFFS